MELHITYIHTKSTIQLASVGLPQTCPMLLTIIVGFHQLLYTICLGILLGTNAFGKWISITLQLPFTRSFLTFSRDQFSRSRESWSHESWSPGNWSRENWSRDTESTLQCNIFIAPASCLYREFFCTAGPRDVSMLDSLARNLKCMDSNHKSTSLTFVRIQYIRGDNHNNLDYMVDI